MTAAADLVGQRFIGYDGNYASAAAIALGVSALSTESGEQVGVQTIGVVEIEAGGAISVAGPVKVGTSGKGVAQGGSGVIVAYAIDESTGDGQKIRVKLV
jgi:hypothetical protein